MSGELEAYDLVMMRRNPAVRFDEVLRARNREDHGRYIAELAERGAVAARGPLIDQPDPGDRGLLHGMIFFPSASPSETRRLVAADPAVQEGRLVPEFFTWRCWSGSLAVPGRPVERGESARWEA